MNEAYLLIGGNMGDRMHYLLAAKKMLQLDCGTITRQSSVYETEAWGMENQDPFLNQAVLLETELTAKELLVTILVIEEKLGRKREVKYGPRLIDIDILFYNDEVIKIDNLKLPHPQIQYRRFALQCLNDIASGKIHPVFQKPVAQLLAECTDPLTVNKFS